jgi:hypothetical protein
MRDGAKPLRFANSPIFMALLTSSGLDLKVYFNVRVKSSRDLES